MLVGLHESQQLREVTAVGIYLFVCGLNMVCCSSSMAEKKSIKAFCPGVFVLESDEELASGAFGIGATLRIVNNVVQMLYGLRRTDLRGLRT